MRSKTKINDRFGRLVVLRRAGKSKHNKSVYECVCDCGAIALVVNGHLRSGHTNSCGCFNRDICRELQTKHGVSDHDLYSTWKDIKRRCYDENNKNYRWYGAKGVKMCADWLNSPKEFVDWGKNNGWVEGITIDRLDSSGDYEPENCQFISRSENTLKMINEHYR